MRAVRDSTRPRGGSNGARSEEQLKAFGFASWGVAHQGARRRALDITRLDQSKGSLTAKLKRAGWNDEFMLNLLNQMR
jgi:hypothetical protein